VAVEDPLQVGRHQVLAGAIFESGIETDEYDVEVAAISRRVSQAPEDASINRRSRDR
jgi:hypothetical protein